MLLHPSCPNWLLADHRVNHHPADHLARLQSPSPRDAAKVQKSVALASAHLCQATTAVYGGAASCVSLPAQAVQPHRLDLQPTHTAVSSAEEGAASHVVQHPVPVLGGVGLARVHRCQGAPLAAGNVEPSLPRRANVAPLAPVGRGSFARRRRGFRSCPRRAAAAGRWRGHPPRRRCRWQGPQPSCSCRPRGPHPGGRIQSRPSTSQTPSFSYRSPP